MIAWDPDACKGLRKRRWRGGLLEPGEALHGAQICPRLESISVIAAAHGCGILKLCSVSWGGRRGRCSEQSRDLVGVDMQHKGVKTCFDLG